MKLKHIFKKVHIPNVKPHVMAYAIQQGFSSPVKPNFFKRFTLQIVTMLVLMLGIGILTLSLNETEVYAFENFDEALMSSMVSVEYLLDQYETSEIESDVNSTQYLFIEEAKSVFTYMKWLEIMTQNVRDFNVEKQIVDEKVSYVYEVNDLTQKYEKLLEIKKTYQDIQQDEFDFSGEYQESIHISGHTEFIDGVHVLRIEASKDDVTMFVTMKNADALQYDIEINEPNGNLLVSYEVTYDEFGIPSMLIHYKEDTVEGNFFVTRRFDQRGIEISYTLTKDNETEEGSIVVSVRMIPKFMYVMTGQINNEDVRFIVTPQK